MHNFITIGQTVLEIAQFFNFQDGHSPPSWIFRFFIFFVNCQIGRPNMHRRMPYFTKIGQTVAEIIAFLKMTTVGPLGFLKVRFFEQLVSVGGLKCVITEKFHQNWPYGCRDIAIFRFSS